LRMKNELLAKCWLEKNTHKIVKQSSIDKLS